MLKVEQSLDKLTKELAELKTKADAPPPITDVKGWGKSDDIPTTVERSLKSVDNNNNINVINERHSTQALLEELKKTVAPKIVEDRNS